MSALRTLVARALSTHTQCRFDRLPVYPRCFFRDGSRLQAALYGIVLSGSGARSARDAATMRSQIRIVAEKYTTLDTEHLRLAMADLGLQMSMRTWMEIDKAVFIQQDFCLIP